MTLHELYESLEQAIDDPVLDAQLAAVRDNPEAADTIREAFRIDTLAQADWAARKVAQARRRLAEAEDVAAAQIERINAWLAEQRQRCDRDTVFLTGLLERFHRERLADDPKAKTIDLPSGAVLVARKQPDCWTFDDDQFVEWARTGYPDAVRVRTSVEVDRTVAKKLPVVDGQVVAPSGEVVPGVEVTPGEVRFTVKTEVDS